MRAALRNTGSWMWDKYEGPEGPSSYQGKRVRLVALVLTLRPTSCMLGLQGSLAPFQSLMVSGHFGATPCKKGRWEPLVCFHFPTGVSLGCWWSSFSAFFFRQMLTQKHNMENRPGCRRTPYAIGSVCLLYKNGHRTILCFLAHRRVWTTHGSIVWLQA